VVQHSGLIVLVRSHHVSELRNDRTTVVGQHSSGSQTVRTGAGRRPAMGHGGYWRPRFGVSTAAAGDAKLDVPFALGDRQSQCFPGGRYA
jgi:hypothetical protein